MTTLNLADITCSTHDTFIVNRVKKILICAVLGSAAAFILFIVMQLLIKNNYEVEQVSAPIPLDSIVMTQPNETVITKPTPTPVLKPPAKPPAKMTRSASTLTLVETPIVRVHIEPSHINNGAGKIALSPNQNGNAKPIFRVEPRYPISAQQKGIEGWVKLAFSITPLGEVTGIQIIDAYPKGIFNREAKKALSKWKYKAKAINGKFVSQDGLSVQLDFKLSH